MITSLHYRYSYIQKVAIRCAASSYCVSCCWQCQFLVSVLRSRRRFGRRVSSADLSHQRGFWSSGRMDEENPENEARARRLEQQFASLSSKKFSLKKVDMDEDDMVRYTIVCSNRALDSGETEDKMADSIKQAFDAKYGPLWHCVVGRKYGSHVTHEKGCFIYFHMHTVAILLFKSKED